MEASIRLRRRKVSETAVPTSLGQPLGPEAHIEYSQIRGEELDDKHRVRKGKKSPASGISTEEGGEKGSR